MMTDPISDMLTRIRNAGLARHDRTEVPASRLKEAVAGILKLEGFIADVRPSEGPGPKKLTIVLKYGRDRQSAIDGVKRISRPGRRVYVRHDHIPRVSRPGRRVYVRHDHIPRVLSGLGISILSTSRGLMSDREARRQKIGGELICEVW